MVLDPIPQSLPVHFYGSRPQPPTSRYACDAFCRFPRIALASWKDTYQISLGWYAYDGFCRFLWIALRYVCVSAQWILSFYCPSHTWLTNRTCVPWLMIDSWVCVTWLIDDLVIFFVHRIRGSRTVHEWVMTQIRMRHVTRMNQSCLTTMQSILFRENPFLSYFPQICHSHISQSCSTGHCWLARTPVWVVFLKFWRYRRIWMSSDEYEFVHVWRTLNMNELQIFACCFWNRMSYVNESCQV